MDRVLDVVIQAGSLPLDELKIRAGNVDVTAGVDELKKQGLVEVKREKLPESTEAVDVVSLTRKGFRSALR